MKIYYISWFNEDDYGATDGLALIINAENEEKATEIARNHVQRMYNIEKLEEVYSVFHLMDVTGDSVLSCSHIGFG